MKDNKFVRGRIKSVSYSFIGAYRLVTSEHSIIVQFFIGLAVTAAGFYFDISATEWMLQTLAIGMVMAIEGANTAVEKICDFIHPDFNPKIGFIKDIASGAVFFAAVAAIVIGAIIYYPKVAMLF
ncbi:diacylglycerol kinase [Flavobacterium akiainvivens]|uniref:Diacylglycerol kinase n=1 Tax=Flavobacterium akiainvivens TaxID=1202724 RepID=A0A0M8MEU4_9FLAO|nr:diacylglycerol kinase family protein [Flavobacterium akiainvivens]KOS04781.1 diacylglycerol kinase [Flavobacterium akiainvivens]SFQ66331.1 diacylglycerol kinase (ATP) [Flavobacterium akiainvivens]